MPNLHEEPEWVNTYRRSSGTEVRAHPSHALVGEPIFFVLYRPKNYRLPGGSREEPRNAHYHWRAVRRRFRTMRAADAKRRALMRRGFHAIVEEIGGRDRRVPTFREMEEEAGSADRGRRE